MKAVHTIPPVFDRDCTLLILGSFPSVKSRETGFYYGNPQNRFWLMLQNVYQEAELPQTMAQKISLLIKHQLALWDVLESCEITGSSDSSIRNPVPNALDSILSQTEIRKILLNGKTAASLFRKFFPAFPLPAVCLPSTSPANAAWSLERLTVAWRAELLP